MIAAVPHLFEFKAEESIFGPMRSQLIDDALREAARLGKLTDPQRLRDDLTVTPARLKDDVGLLLDSLNNAPAPNAEVAIQG